MIIVIPAICFYCRKNLKVLMNDFSENVTCPICNKKFNVELLINVTAISLVKIGEKNDMGKIRIQ